jgi:hypothetical protein
MFIIREGEKFSPGNPLKVVKLRRENNKNGCEQGTD